MALCTIGIQMLAGQEKLEGLVLEPIFERRWVDYAMPISGVMTIRTAWTQVVLVNVLMTINALRVVDVDIAIV